MVSSRMKRQSNTGLLTQLDNFDQDIIIGNTMKDRQENATVNKGTTDQEITVGISDSNPTANKNLVNVKTLKSCINERINREMGNIVDTVEERFLEAILTAIDNINQSI